MISDYASLQSTIADYLGRSTVTTQALGPAAPVQEFISQAEGRIYRELRVRDMEEALTGTLTSN